MLSNMKNLFLDPAAPGSEGGVAQVTTPPAGWFSPEAHATALEQVRKQEKDKLYPTISGLEQKVASLTAELAAQVEKHGKLQTQYDTVAAARAGDGPVNLKNLIEEATTRALALAEEKYRGERETLSSEIQTIKGKNRDMELRTYRNEAVRNAGGEDALVVALVGGESEQAIDESIVRAKEAFDAVAARVKAPASDSTLNTRNGNERLNMPYTPGRSAVPANRGPEGTRTTPIPSNVRAMTNAEFAAQRKQLKEATNGRYTAAP